MAGLRSRTILVALFLLVLIAFSSVAEARRRSTNCHKECGRRCSKTHHRKPCMVFCLQCCATCGCVPPGTYGNKEVCACYNNWKTKEGRPKCP